MNHTTLKVGNDGDNQIEKATSSGLGDAGDDIVDQAAEMFADLFLRQYEYRKRKRQGEEHSGSSSQDEAHQAR